MPDPSTSHPSRPCRRRAAAAAGFSSFLSTTTHSVVSSRPGDRRGVLQRRAGDLGRVDDAGLAPGPRRCRSRRCSRSSSPSTPCTFATTIEPSAPAFWAIIRIGSSSARRTISTPIFSSSVPLILSSADCARRKRDAAAGHDALLDRRAGGVERVLDPSLLLLHLGLGGRADVDDRHAAGELGQPLLELLPVVVAGGLLDRDLDLADPALDVVGLALAVDDGGVVLVDHDPLGPAEILERGVLQLEADLLGDHLAAGEHRDVPEHLLAAVAEARRLDGGDLERAAELVHHQRGERLALDVLGDDQRAACRSARPSRGSAAAPSSRRSSCRGSGCRRLPAPPPSSPDR